MEYCNCEPELDYSQESAYACPGYLSKVLGGSMDKFVEYITKHFSRIWRLGACLAGIITLGQLL